MPNFDEVRCPKDKVVDDGKPCLCAIWLYKTNFHLAKGPADILFSGTAKFLLGISAIPTIGCPTNVRVTWVGSPQGQ